MDSLKYGVLVSGLAGIVGCFLPLGGPGDATFWDLFEIDKAQTLMVMAGYALGVIMAIAAVVRPPILRVQAILAAGGFGFVLFKMRDGIKDFIVDGGIGAKLMAIAPLAGIAFAVLCIVKAESSPR